jgi:hypothetical protein
MSQGQFEFDIHEGLEWMFCHNINSIHLVITKLKPVIYSQKKNENFNHLTFKAKVIYE